MTARVTIHPDVTGGITATTRSALTPGWLLDVVAFGCLLVPGVIGFGNHPFALQRGLCTVELGWSSLTEAAVEKFTGMGRRARSARAFVIPGPSGTPSREHPLAEAIR